MRVQSGCGFGAGGAGRACFHRAHLVQVFGLSDVQDLPKCRLWSSGRVFPPFCPLSRFVCGAFPLNMALFRVFRGFLAWFGVQMYICMG